MRDNRSDPYEVRHAEMTAETHISQEIRQACCRGNVRFFKNNVGKLQDKTGRWVKFGLFTGSGDFIGWRTITITPDMVGKQIAQFVSIEVKAKTSERKAQGIWRRAVLAAGGVAGVVRSVAEAESLLRP